MTPFAIHRSAVVRRRNAHARGEVNPVSAGNANATGAWRRKRRSKRRGQGS